MIAVILVRNLNKNDDAGVNNDNEIGSSHYLIFHQIKGLKMLSDVKLHQAGATTKNDILSKINGGVINLAGHLGWVLNTLS